MTAHCAVLLFESPPGGPEATGECDVDQSPVFFCIHPIA